MRDLEEKLMLTTPSHSNYDAVSSTSSSPQRQSSQPDSYNVQMHDSQQVASAPVDTLATGAFDQIPVENIGYFGTLP